jgi:acylphosphatase
MARQGKRLRSLYLMAGFVNVQHSSWGEKKRCLHLVFYGFMFATLWADVWQVSERRRVMQRCRMKVYYSGRVQGVGFRYAVKALAPGFEVTGTIKNLADGRVELVAEGEKSELEAFHQSVLDSGLKPLIREADVHWAEARNEFKGFEIVR